MKKKENIKDYKNKSNVLKINNFYKLFLYKKFKNIIYIYMDNCMDNMQIYINKQGFWLI